VIGQDEHLEGHIRLVAQRVLVRSGVADADHGAGENESVARLFIALGRAAQPVQGPEVPPLISSATVPTARSESAGGPATFAARTSGGGRS
jgi:hypothetical protein